MNENRVFSNVYPRAFSDTKVYLPLEFRRDDIGGPFKATYVEVFDKIPEGLGQEIYG